MLPEKTPLRRHEVVQSYLDMFEAPHYLEVGVSHGKTFHAIKAARKVAVDPKFRIPAGEREASSEYHEVTSDAYFEGINSDRTLFDVIYLDGLHTHEQIIRDLMNAIEYLHRDGVIIIDDVSPPTYHASLQDMNEASVVRQAVGATGKAWMGDVYKAVYFVQSFLPAFDYATVADNHGQLVMWRGKREPDSFVERKLEDIARMEFRHILADKRGYNRMPNARIVKRVRALRQGKKAGGDVPSPPDPPSPMKRKA